MNNNQDMFILFSLCLKEKRMAKTNKKKIDRYKKRKGGEGEWKC